MKYQHKIPLHLEEPDTFLWSLTGRQVLVVALGLGVGYLIFTDVTMQVTPLSLLLGIFLWAVLAVAAFIVAFVRVQKRPLEEWGLIWFLYQSRSRFYLWRPVFEDESVNENEREVNEQEQEKSERW